MVSGPTASRHHHAVQAGGDGEQVPHEVLAGPLEEVVEDLDWIETVEVGQELDDVVMRRTGLGSLAGDVQLHPVAGGEQHRLRFRILLPQARKGRRRLILAEGQPLADLHGGRMMAAPDHLQLHRSSSVGWASCPPQEEQLVAIFWAGWKPAPPTRVCCDDPSMSSAITIASMMKLTTVRYATFRPC